MSVWGLGRRVHRAEDDPTLLSIEINVDGIKLFPEAIR